MYCPKCGIQDNDDTKFCRGCGENLKLISQAMTRRLPVILASKVDAYLERKNERLRRDSIIGAVAGSLWLLYGLRTLVTGAGTVAPLPIVLGCLILLWALWEHMVYKHSLSRDSKMEKFRGASTDELPRDAAQVEEPYASATEFTTEHLDASIRQQEKS